jgi:hypothetical protein
MTTVTKQIHFAFKKRRKLARPGPMPPTAAPEGRIPRVSKLMALAIRFDQMLNNVEVTDLSELARLAQVTQPRMTQIMNLNHLAPDIQEAVLHLESTPIGRDAMNERLLRQVCAVRDWSGQRRLWKKLCANSCGTPGPRRQPC